MNVYHFIHYFIHTLFNVTSNVVRSRGRIRKAIGPYDDILTTVKKRKLTWFAHVSRSAEPILQGTVQGGRRRGRQKKRWENNISERRGLKFCDALREAESKIKWRERVARSVALQQSPWARDRCRCMAFFWWNDTVKSAIKYPRVSAKSQEQLNGRTRNGPIL